MFPLIMGKETAHMMLAESKSLTADQALAAGLVDFVYPANEVISKAQEYSTTLAALPSNSEQLKKRIVKLNIVEILKKVNEEECKECEKKWVCKESFAAMATYMESRGMRAPATILR